MAYSTVQCFKKKCVHSERKNADYYFLAIRDNEGYSNDQIVNRATYESVDPPCMLEYEISCSGQRPSLIFRQVE